MGHRLVSGGCHPAEWKNGNFVALRRLSLDEEELDGGGVRVRSFIFKSAQQEEALHHIYNITFPIKRACTTTLAPQPAGTPVT
ncbi:unnamed protein product [Spirodela intermedia]|uniref:Uncharacterized protein n=1 Tax=Spirodela intermedia TaxID=51605 RepID=A0ABN7EAA2_SPIIN|nr:unnamed protein product [Spirodela intermedia]